MEENKPQYLFGMHPVLEAVKAGKKFDKVLLKQGLEGPQFRELLVLLNDKKINYQYVPIEKLNRSVRGAHQGVIAYISQIDYVSIEDMVNNALATRENPLLVILDGVSDVRNLGAIARSLECAGGCGIILPAKGGAAINAEAVKASAGALMRIDACKVPNLRVAAYYLKQSGFRIVAATEKVDRLIYDVDLTGPCAIVMGSEGSGISRSMLELSDDRAAIPMAGEITSLNVSVATSVVLYEAVRQRIASAGK
ncbi:MAG: 23S rRNA (guanosine(2251)-2'-O)-methyltransferase RlmB [Bacteroidales bacterium]|nr:23S rRNA (guanosine(2251)-2'-O)-methyltransferase RlmB [Bacteroidales bacterium]